MGVLHSTLREDAIITVSLPHHNSPGETIVLTRNDVKVIRSDVSWLLSHDNFDNIVTQMYQRMFVLNPSSQLTFLRYPQLRGDELFKNPYFQRNVINFGKSLVKLIGLLSNVPALLMYLDELGLKHRLLSTMRDEHVEAVEKALNTIFEMHLMPRFGAGRKSAKKQATSQAAWSKMFRLITQRIYSSYMSMEE